MIGIREFDLGLNESELGVSHAYENCSGAAGNDVDDLAVRAASTRLLVES